MSYEERGRLIGIIKSPSSYMKLCEYQRMHQGSDCVFQSFVKKLQFFMHQFEIKNESVDCEAYKEPIFKKYNHRTRESIAVPTMMISWR